MDWFVTKKSEYVQPKQYYHSFPYEKDIQTSDACSAPATDGMHQRRRQCHAGWHDATRGPMDGRCDKCTQTLWGDGKALRMTELASDGTGSTDIYYLLNEDIAVGHSHQTFRYTASTDGQLTMTMDGSQTTETATWSVANGQLTLQTDDQALTLQKTDAATEKKMAEWNADKLINVPEPARYTVFVYGNAGGDMDNIIEEGLWERLQPLLTDQSNVRVICFYKYGEKTNSKYDYDGDIVWFELNSNTDLRNLKNDGLQALGLEQEAKDMKLCDPATLRMFMRWSSLICPANRYVFAIWGHGSGFEANLDVPGKYYTSLDNTTRGVPCSTLPTMPTRWLRRPPTLSSLR